MSDIRLQHIKRLSAQIRVITGLHVGGSKDDIEIGGMDNPIIKNPVTGEPYIPGSSLKGKMRSLLEAVTSKISPDGKVHGYKCIDDKCPVCRIFGNTENSTYGPTRIIVRDATLNREATRKALNLDPDFPVTDIIEDKMENSINRIKGKADNPRPQERVVPGAVFNLEIRYRVYSVDGDQGVTDEDLFSRHICQILTLIEHDYLGGNGTRGCGQVKFENIQIEDIQPAELLQTREV